MFRTLSVALFLALPALAQTITDEQFVTAIKDGVRVAHDQNPEVKLLGIGTADLLDSGRPSKVGCGKSNPNPKPGECSGTYPIYPAAMSLTDAVENEKATPAKAKHIPTTWVAWRDGIGIINIAFNAKAGDYEVTTPYEVEDDGVWWGLNIYQISIRLGDEEFHTAIKNKGESLFTWLKLGKGGGQEFSARLKALEDLHIIANVQTNPEATTVASK